MTHIQEEKKILRKHIKTLKSSYTFQDLENKSHKIITHIQNFLNIQKPSIIMAYWSLPDEVLIQEWIIKNSSQYTILLPVIHENELVVIPFTGTDNMQKVPPFGILEPIGETFHNIDKIEIILVPGMAFDRRGFRMGRGKGYYDKFLPKTSGIRVGICFDFQLLDKIPIDEYDAQMDYIITENELLTINKKAL
ncbi:MAG: 5-formyltetrahydrofolate cyclo-ligase [Bacteroidales bacterium]|nr:5-formyltetrahydrofolate cyclo-ligase [Bacteroidales bacterium]